MRPGKLGVDIYFVGFEASISKGDAGWHPGVMLLPPLPAARTRADKQQQSEERDARSPPPLWRRWLLKDGRQTAALFLERRARLDARIWDLRFLLGHQNACSSASRPEPFKGDLDEIGVVKPLAVIENGNDFRGDAEQGYLV